MAKSSLTYTERQQLEHLTSRLGPTTPANRRERIQDEIAQLIQGKELTRSDIALAAYYTKHHAAGTDDIQAAEAYAQAYRQG